MTGEGDHLERALALFPMYAEAFYAQNVIEQLSAGDPVMDDKREQVERDFIITAWCFATSEILELRRFYLEHRADLEALFSAAEYDELIASFS